MSASKMKDALQSLETEWDAYRVKWAEPSGAKVARKASTLQGESRVKKTPDLV